MDCHPWREDLPVGQGRWKRATSRCDGVITATSVLSPNYAGTPALTAWTMRMNDGPSTLLLVGLPRPSDMQTWSRALSLLFP